MRSAVVAIAQNNVIGSNNDLPWYLPADLKHFKALTIGKTVVMGSKTFQSIIDRLGKPLPDRKNVVITRQTDFSYPGVTVIHDVSEIPEGEVMMIGGADIYRQTLPLVDRLYVTEVHADIDGDVTFPVLNEKEWTETSLESHTKDEKNQYDYDFVVYDRVK